MSALNNNNTLTYDEGAGGWPSFYSYAPDWMIGMNNYFYTFNKGNLYRHNVNEVRNNFYGVQYTSTLQSVFNDIPLENKLFKTINLEGDSAWGITLKTDIQDSGFIEVDWFSKKEQSFYAFVRNSGETPAGTDEYALRSLNGIGRSSTVTGAGGAVATITFPASIELETIMSVGDMLYYVLPPSGVTPNFVGQITNIQSSPQEGLNTITIDTTVSGAVLIPAQDNYFLYIKNSVAESHGVLGHYCVFNITNTDIEKFNLFAVETEVMKSYP
jgi:hypothetical protein